MTITERIKVFLIGTICTVPPFLLAISNIEIFITAMFSMLGLVGIYYIGLIIVTSNKKLMDLVGDKDGA